MPKTILYSRLHSNKQKIKIEPELNQTKSNLPPNLHSSKQKLLSGSGFLVFI